MLLLVLHFCFPKSFINLNPTHKAKETLQHIILKKKLRLCVENITCQKLTTTTFFQILAKFAKFYCSGKVYFTKIVALEKVIIKQCCSLVCNFFSDTFLKSTKVVITWEMWRSSFFTSSNSYFQH